MSLRALWESGVQELIPILPPDAPLRGAGKVPGIWTGDRWAYLTGWTKFNATLKGVQQWVREGANTGVLAARNPAFDLDLEPEAGDLLTLLWETVERVAGRSLVRWGSEGRIMIAYRTDTPMRKRVLRFSYGGTESKIELLGEGQQWVADGTHPSGRPYRTEGTPTHITHEVVGEVFDALEEAILLMGGEILYRGSGLQGNRDEVDQQGIKAHMGLEQVRVALSQIPNDERYDDRDSWRHIITAIKGALYEEDWLDGLALAVEWSNSRDDFGDQTAQVEALWDSLRPPFALGIDVLLAAAGLQGERAAAEFDVIAERPENLPVVGGAGPDPLVGEAGRIQRLVYEYSDQQLARRFMGTEAGQDILHTTGWMFWDGVRWYPDTQGKRVMTAIMDFLREVTYEVMDSDLPLTRQNAIASRIDGIAGARAVAGVLEARWEIHREIDSFDPDDHLLNTPSGVVDLTTGEARPHRKGLMCSMVTEHAPTTDLPMRWLQYIEEMTEGDADLAHYLHKLAGYALLGGNPLEIVNFFTGPGGNGKSTYTETLAYIMGEYAATLPTGSLTASTHSSGGEGASPVLAGLRGKRLAITSESKAGGQWDEDKVKAWSGGEKVTARHLHREPFTFLPKFKLMMTSNSEPSIAQRDRGWERRLRVIPCDFVPEVDDGDLKRYLREDEGPAILQWAIDGAVAFLREGLTPPEAVREATADYFDANDPIGTWLRAGGTVDITGEGEDFSLTSDLRLSYNAWAQALGYRAMSPAQFGSGLKKRLQGIEGVGYTRRGPQGDRGYHGIRIHNMEGVLV